MEIYLNADKNKTNTQKHFFFFIFKMKNPSWKLFAGERLTAGSEGFAKSGILMKASAVGQQGSGCRHAGSRANVTQEDNGRELERGSSPPKPGDLDETSLLRQRKADQTESQGAKFST